MDIRNRKEYYKKYYLANRERKKLNYKKWISCHKDRTLKYNTDYRNKNLEKIRSYYREYRNRRYKTDPQFKLSTLLRSRINQIMRGQKRRSAIIDLGCSLAELRFFLEGKFVDGMTWENYGKWHVDHIVPLSYFDLQNEEQFKQSCHYTNLQPLWAKDNLSKGNRINFKELNSLPHKADSSIS